MVYLDTMPLRFGHFRVLITTAMGQFLGAAVATLSGVLIPLLAIVQHHELDSVTQGLIASMELIGIMVGSFVIGKLADKDGYLPFLRLSSILVFIGALVVYVTGSIDLLIHSLFVMGFGIGGDLHWIPTMLMKSCRNAGRKRWSVSPNHFLLLETCQLVEVSSFSVRSSGLQKFGDRSSYLWSFSHF